jgi:hypothetical protein
MILYEGNRIDGRKEVPDAEVAFGFWDSQTSQMEWPLERRISKYLAETYPGAVAEFEMPLFVDVVLHLRP